MGSRKTDYLRHSTSGSSSGPRSRFFEEIYKYVGQSAHARQWERKTFASGRVPAVSGTPSVNIYRNFLLYISQRPRWKRLALVWVLYQSGLFLFHSLVLLQKRRIEIFHSRRENSDRCSKSFEKTCSLSQEAARIAQHKQWLQRETITLILSKCMKQNQRSRIIHINVGFLLLELDEGNFFYGLE